MKREWWSLYKCSVIHVCLLLVVSLLILWVSVLSVYVQPRNLMNVPMKIRSFPICLEHLIDNATLMMYLFTASLIHWLSAFHGHHRRHQLPTWASKLSCLLTIRQLITVVWVKTTQILTWNLLLLGYVGLFLTYITHRTILKIFIHLPLEPHRQDLGSLRY